MPNVIATVCKKEEDFDLQRNRHAGKDAGLTAAHSPQVLAPAHYKFCLSARPQPRLAPRTSQLNRRATQRTSLTGNGGHDVYSES